MSNKLGSLQRQLLSILLNNAGGRGAYSVNQLVEETGSVKMSINRALQGLIKMGKVTRETGRIPGQGRWCYLYRAVTPKRDLHSWRAEAITSVHRYVARLEMDNPEAKYQLEEAVSYMIHQHPHIFEMIAATIYRQRGDI